MVKNNLEDVLIFEENEETRRAIRMTIQEVFGNGTTIIEASTTAEYHTKLSDHRALVVFDGDALSDSDRDVLAEVRRLHKQGSKVLVLLQENKPREYRNTLVRNGAIGSLIKPQIANPGAGFFNALRIYLEYRVMNIAAYLGSLAVIGAGNAGKAAVCEAVRIPAVKSVSIYSHKLAETAQACYSGQTTAAAIGRTGNISVGVTDLKGTNPVGTRLTIIGKKGLEQRIFEDAEKLEKDALELEEEYTQRKSDFIRRGFINLYKTYGPDIIDIFSSGRDMRLKDIIVTNPVAPLVMLTNIVATEGDFKELGNTNIEGLCYVDYSRCVSLLAEWWLRLNEKRGITEQEIYPNIKIMGLHGFGTVALNEVLIANYHTEVLKEILDNDPTISKDHLLRAPFERGIAAARKANGTYTPTETGASAGAAIVSILGDRESYASVLIRPLEYVALREGSFKVGDGSYMPYEKFWEKYFPYGCVLDVPGFRVSSRFIPDKNALSRSLPEDDRYRLGGIVKWLLEMRNCMVDDAIDNIKKDPKSKYCPVYRNVLRFFNVEQPP